VNVWPAMVIVPVRSVASTFGETLYRTGPEPGPDAPLVTISQSAFDVAVQAQAGAEAVTIKLPLPPGAASRAAFSTATSHFAAVGDVTEIDEDVPPQAVASNQSAQIANGRARMACEAWCKQFAGPSCASSARIRSG